jgi:hypothetical protein
MVLKDLQGKLVKEIVNERMTTGIQEIRVSLEGLSQNLYILEMQTESGRFLHKLMVE